MKFAFIHAEKANHSVARLCTLLGVTRQGYYAYMRRRPSPRVQRDRVLVDDVQRIYQESRGNYGSPRIWRQLRRLGQHVGKRRVERTMRALALVGRPTRRFRVTTKADAGHSKAPNLLGRDFTASRPNERWVTDITYAWTAEGWCYLAVVIDLFSRAVVGWSVDAHLATGLPMRALQSALSRRRPGQQLLHHSDQGSQYTSHEYRHLLARHGIQVSMSRRRDCWDNAVAESFFSTLKAELIERRRWKSRIELRSALFDYVEVFYNRSRLHSTLAYQTPAEVELEYARTTAA
jgi:putative transposase